MKATVNGPEGEVNVRLGPDRTMTVIGTLPNGTAVEVEDTGSEYAEIRAYMKRALLRFEAPATLGPALGMNVRGLVHYGHAELPASQSGQQAEALEVLQAAGVKMVRVFAASRLVPAADAAPRLRATLDAVQARGMQAIVCLTNEYGDTPFQVPGDEKYYQDNLLTPAWIAQGYSQNYRPYVESLVQACAGHPGLLAWELCNELTIGYPNEGARPDLVAFVEIMAARIRDLDPKTLLAGGFMNSVHAGPNNSASYDPAFAEALYEPLDIITLHFYDDVNRGRGQQDLAQFKNYKPVIVEEFGASGDRRPDQLRAEFDRWFSLGASACLPWGFMASAADNGDGDRVWGIDRVFHRDWDAVTSMLGDYARHLTAVAPAEAPAPRRAVDIPPVGQRDEHWANREINHSGKTLGQVGCLITSLSMAAGLPPDQMLDALTAHHLIGTSDCAACLNNFDVAAAAPLRLIYTSAKWKGVPTPAAELAKLTQHLDGGKPAVIEVDADIHTAKQDQHFVLGVGLDGQGRVLINDPWFADRALLCPRYYADLQAAVYRFVLYDWG